MKLVQMQRRAYGTALMATLLLGLLALGYWSGMRQGLLPSPMQPIGGASRAQGSASPVTVNAVPEAANRPSQREHSTEGRPQPGPTAQPDASASASSDETRDATGHRPPSMQAPPTTSAARGVSYEQETRAQMWLSATNNRPVVRVHYNPEDILRLVEKRRGALVARSNADSQRELYIKSGARGAPLLAPYTASADQFSSYRLLLASGPGFAAVTAVLPAYFPTGSAELAFAPDQEIAMTIFSEVARAALDSERKGKAARGIYEGRLTVQRTTVAFELLSRSDAK